MPGKHAWLPVRHPLASVGASCGVRELAPAVCRPGLPGRAPRINLGTPISRLAPLVLCSSPRRHGVRVFAPDRRFCRCSRRGIRRGGCPANILGSISAIHLDRRAASFRAERPAPFPLREAPGRKVGLPGRRLVEPGRSSKNLSWIASVPRRSCSAGILPAFLPFLETPFGR